jgi:hypothetical protein
MKKLPAAASVALFLAVAADPPTSLNTGEIVGHLARTIAWYHHVAAVEQAAQPTADLLAPDGPNAPPLAPSSSHSTSRAPPRPW